jgi:hypothetical protein
VPGLEPFVCLGNLIQGQQLICERAHLPAFYQAGHLIEPRLLSQEEHAMERLVKPVGASSTHRRANARVLPGSSSGLLRPAIPLAILPALLSLLLAFFSAFLPALLSLLLAFFSAFFSALPACTLTAVPGTVSAGTVALASVSAFVSAFTPSSFAAPFASSPHAALLFSRTSRKTGLGIPSGRLG